MTKHCSRWLGGALLATGLALLPLAAHADPTIRGLSSNQGSLGSYVLIYGSGFGDAQGQSYVMLGQHFVPVVAWSNGAITTYVSPSSMLMGPGESPVLVVVKQPGGRASNGYMLNVAGTGPTSVAPTSVSGTAGGAGPSTATGQTPATTTTSTTAPSTTTSTTAPSTTTSTTAPTTTTSTTAPTTTTSTTAPTVAPGTAVNPGTGVGAASSGIQSLNQALLAEEVSLQFYNLNAGKSFLTATGGATTTTSTTAPSTTTSTTAPSTTTSTTAPSTTTSTTAPSTTTSTTAPSTTTSTTAPSTTTSTTAPSTTTSTTAPSTTTSTTAPSTTTSTTAPTVAPSTTTSASDLAALNSMVQEIRAGHQAHVTMLQQMLGTNAQQMPTFQNLDANSLPQFLTMAQTLEDIDVNVHEGVILSALQSGNLTPLSSTATSTTSTTAPSTTTSTTAPSTTTSTTAPSTTTSTTAPSTTTSTTAPSTTTSTTAPSTAGGGTNGGIYGLEVAILADDARYDGAIRAFERTIPTAEGGNANGTLTETGTPLGTGFTFSQGNAALASYIVGGIPGTTATPGTATSPTSSTSTTAPTTTTSTTAPSTTTSTTAPSTTTSTTAPSTTTSTTAPSTTTGTTAGY